MNHLAYIGRRMKEASSWAGTACFLLGVLHVGASADLVNAILGVVVAVGSVIAVLVPDGPSPSPALPQPAVQPPQVFPAGSKTTAELNAAEFDRNRRG